MCIRDSRSFVARAGGGPRWAADLRGQLGPSQTGCLLRRAQLIWGWAEDLAPGGSPRIRPA
eukprot:388947-Pyramimonas_sp.AAC.1